MIINWRSDENVVVVHDLLAGVNNSLVEKFEPAEAPMIRTTGIKQGMIKY